MAKKPTKSQIRKPKRASFDKDSFVFSTKLDVLKYTLRERYAELEDLMEYQQPSHEQRKRIEDLCYWLGAWEMALPEAERRGMVVVPTSARENAILGIPREKR